MENLEPMEASEEAEHQHEATGQTKEDSAVEEAGEAEETKGIPFGFLGGTFLLNVLQYTLFLGLTMLLLIIIRLLAPESMRLP